MCNYNIRDGDLRRDNPNNFRLFAGMHRQDERDFVQEVEIEYIINVTIMVNILENSLGGNKFLKKGVNNYYYLAKSNVVMNEKQTLAYINYLKEGG